MQYDPDPSMIIAIATLFVQRHPAKWAPAQAIANQRNRPRTVSCILLKVGDLAPDRSFPNAPLINPYFC